MSQTGAFEVLGSRLGLGPKSRAAYVAIDLGLREPTESEQRVLAEWLGGYPADLEASGSGPHSPDASAYLERIDALVEQLAADRAVIRDLLAELRQAQEERAETRAAFLETLRAVGRPGGRGHTGGRDGEPPEVDPLDVAGHARP